MKTLVIEKMPKLFWELVKKQNLTQMKSCLQPDNYSEKYTVEAIIMRTHVQADRPFIDKFPNLKLIIRAGSGFDNIDVRYALSKNIQVCNTPEANVQSAFEHTVNFIFSICKNQKIQEANLLKGKWKSGLDYNLEISDLKILVVGVGRIGTKVAQFFQNFGAEVKGCDPYLTDEEWQEKNIAEIDYENGLMWCNLVTYHCPLTKETEEYFSFSELEILHNPLAIVNTARGKVLNLSAIYDGLSNGKIFATAIDVFPEEPFQLDEKFRDFGSLFVSPHAGAFTQKAKNRMSLETITVWREFVFHQKALSPVDLRFIRN